VRGRRTSPYVVGRRLQDPNTCWKPPGWLVARCCLCGAASFDAELSGSGGNGSWYERWEGSSAGSLGWAVAVWPANPRATVSASGFSGAASAGFGYVPARQAAQRHPIEACEHE